MLIDYETSAPGSFIFSLRNNDDLPPFKASLKNENDGFAIVRSHGYGPIFGSGYDLIIHNNAGSNTQSYANLGDTYKLPSGYTYRGTNTQALLAGSRYFTPSEVEVLYLN